MPKKRHSKLHILITAGPTREYLDSVRFISNPSSGKMGYALAMAAALRGHRVTLVSGPVFLAPPRGVDLVTVETGEEMSAAAKRAFKTADGAIFCAAVCDYRPRKRAVRKLPKSKAGLKLDLLPTEDIAASLGRIKGRRVSVCFALEDHHGRRKAEAKLAAKHADAIVLNGPENVGAAKAAVQLLQRGREWTNWSVASKTVVATRIMRRLEAILENRDS